MKTNKVKCVILDVDGTIFDSEKVWQAAWRKVSKKYGVQISPEMRVRSCGRTPQENIDDWQKCMPGHDAAAVYNDGAEIVRRQIITSGIPLKAGFKSLLRYLKKHDVKIVLATGNTKENVECCFKKVGLDLYSAVDNIFTVKEVKKGKPSPQIYKYVCKQMCLKAKDCLVIEDSPNGVKAATRAGIRTINVPDVFKPTKYTYAHALTILPNLIAVKNYLSINDLLQ